jgi:hypothetical protein
MRCDGIQVVPPNQNFKTKVVNALSNPQTKRLQKFSVLSSAA